MDAPYQGAADVHVFPANLDLPGVGVLEIFVGDRTLTAVAPRLFDNPMSTGCSTGRRGLFERRRLRSGTAPPVARPA